MYEQIIVPLDGSPLAEQVLPYVLKFGLSNNSNVTLLREYNIAAIMLGEPSCIDLDLITDSYRAGAQEYLKRVGDVLGRAGLSISTTAQEGDAASLIVREAEVVREAEAGSSTLIAMSTHGRSGISRWVLGSVTDKVLHAAASPLLIIRVVTKEEATSQQRGEQENSWTGPVVIKNVTVPLDGSLLAEEILDHAVSAAKALEVPVTPVRVATDPSQDVEAAVYLEQASEKLRRQGVSCSGGTLLHGEPADALLNMLQQQPDTLVAMTTRGHSGIQRWVLGSVTDRITRYSGTPVLVARST